MAGSNHSCALTARHNRAAAYDDVMGKLRPALQSALRQYFAITSSAMVFPTVRVTAPPVTEDVFSPAPEVELRGVKYLRNWPLGATSAWRARVAHIQKPVSFDISPVYGYLPRQASSPPTPKHGAAGL